MDNSKNITSSSPFKITIPEPYATLLNWLVEYCKRHPVQKPNPGIHEERGDGFIKITVRLNHT